MRLSGKVIFLCSYLKIWLLVHEKIVRWSWTTRNKIASGAVTINNYWIFGNKIARLRCFFSIWVSSMKSCGFFTPQYKWNIILDFMHDFAAAAAPTTNEPAKNHGRCSHSQTASSAAL